MPVRPGTSLGVCVTLGKAITTEGTDDGCACCTEVRDLTDALVVMARQGYAVPYVEYRLSRVAESLGCTPEWTP
jgi:hypothetical protein